MDLDLIFGIPVALFEDTFYRVWSAMLLPLVALEKAIDKVIAFFG